MLLHEIKRDPIKRKGESVPRFQPGDMPDRFEKVGSGIGAAIMDSEVYLDKKHPNRVLKVVSIRNMMDPYYRFLRMIELHQNNPFFPKIYGIKVHEVPSYTGTSDSGYEYKVQDHILLYVFMERLHNLHSIPEDQARQLLANVGIRYSGRFKDDMSLRMQFGVGNTRRAYTKITPDPKFKAALRLLEPMFRKFGNDMHIENIMVRNTGNGPQLVLVDPLYPDFGEY